MYAQVYTSGPDVCVPDLSILGRPTPELHEATTNDQNDAGQDDDQVENDSRTSHSALMARRAHRRLHSKSFDEDGYQCELLCIEDSGERQYFEDDFW